MLDMKMKIAVTFLLGAIACTGCAVEEASQDANSANSATAALQAVEIRDVEVATAAQLISKHDAVVILDIRTPAEFSKGHIRGAVNVDFMADDFAARLAALDKSATYIMHCQSGGRSGKALPRFRELGFEKVLHLDVGFAGWQKAGQHIEK